MDEIIVDKEGTLSEFIESYRTESPFKNPELVRIAITFRDGSNGDTETRSINHKSYEHEE